MGVKLETRAAPATHYCVCVEVLRWLVFVCVFPEQSSRICSEAFAKLIELATGQTEEKASSCRSSSPLFPAHPCFQESLSSQTFGPFRQTRRRMQVLFRNLTRISTDGCYCHTLWLCSGFMYQMIISQSATNSRKRARNDDVSYIYITYK